MIEWFFSGLNISLTDFILQQFLPLLLAVGFYSLIIKYIYRTYIEFDWERWLPGLLIGSGLAAVIYVIKIFTKSTDFKVVSNLTVYLVALFAVAGIGLLLLGKSKSISSKIKKIISLLMILAIIKRVCDGLNLFLLQFTGYRDAVEQLQGAMDIGKQVALAKYSEWSFIGETGSKIQAAITREVPYILEALISVGVWVALATTLAVRYRTSIWWAVKVILVAIPKSVLLAMQWEVKETGFSSETPFADYFMKQWALGYIKNTLTETQRKTAAGDSKGTGADIEQNDELKEQLKTLKSTKVSVVTRRGKRSARIRFKLPADQKFKSGVIARLAPLGTAIRFRSVVFPNTPAEDGKWLVFKSDVPYRAGERASTSFLDLFVPFWIIEKDEDGNTPSDESISSNFKSVLKMFADYLTILTPPGMKNYLIGNLKRTLYVDDSIVDAKYPIQGHNIDYEVFPDRTEEISDKAKRALKIAEKRALNVDVFMSETYGKGSYINGSVEVSGSTAIYSYTFNQVVNFTKTETQKLQVALHTKEQIDFQYSGGELKIMVPNSVGLEDPDSITIPGDVVAMFKSMPMNPKEFTAGMSGVRADGSPALVQLGSSNPHLFLFGKTGSGKTATIFDIMFSMMNNRSPDDLQFVCADGKGNTFSFLENNPYMMAKPASFSKEPEYLRKLLLQVQDEVIRRINLFDATGNEKITDYNAEHPGEKMPYIVLVCDEFSAIIDKDGDLKRDERYMQVEPIIEYIAKMARSAGIMMVLANQTARADKVPGNIKANITAYISLMVAQPVEARIALPEAEENPYFLTAQGDHYSEFSGPNHIVRAQSAYIDGETAEKINENLIQKFGECDYFFGDKDLIMTKYGDTTAERPSARHAVTEAA